MIHATADVHESVTMGEDVHIWAGAGVMAGTVIGAHVSIGRHAELGRFCEIGEGTRISYGVFLPNHSRIGRGVFIGPGAIFTDDRYPKANNPWYRRESPIVEDDVSVGAGAVILPGVRLGQGCMVAAGAVVTHDVPPHVTVKGNPARLPWDEIQEAVDAHVR